MEDMINKVKSLKNQYIEAGKKIAGYESSLKMLKQQEVELLKKCKEINVDPNHIDDRILQLTNTFNKLISTIEETLNPNTEVNDSDLNDLIEDIELDEESEEEPESDSDDDFVMPDDEEAI
jgi:chromosome segregation ATPase